MTIFVANTTDLAAAISTVTQIPFAAADFVFGTPRTTTPTETVNYGKNSAVVVAASPTSSAKVVGSALLMYNRLPLKPLETYYLAAYAIPDGAALAVWLPRITAYLNIPLLVTDLIDHPSVLVGNNVTVILEASPTSLGWFGTATLTFKAYPDISTAFTTNQLTGF